MSTEAVVKTASIKAWLRTLCQDQNSVRIIRFAIGVTLAAALAYGINWPLSFLLPILTSLMLSLPLPMPSLRAGLRNMLYTLMAFGLGLIFSLFFLQYPFVYIVMLGLVLFHLYYYLNRGGSLWLALLSIVAILLLSMVGNSHEGLATDISLGFIGTGWLTMMMVWVSHRWCPIPGLHRFRSHPASSRAILSLPPRQLSRAPSPSCRSPACL
jgi:hypothetical protein